MSSTAHSARKTHLKEIPFKESSLKLNYVCTQFSQQTKPAAFRVTTWIFYGTGHDHQTQTKIWFYPRKNLQGKKTKHG